MAVHDPIWLQAKSYAASEDRLLLSALMPGGGVVRSTSGSGGLLVTQTATASMNVQIAAGYAFVPGSIAAATQGTYFVYNDASVTVTLAASDPSLPRVDLIVVRVQDSAFAGSVDSATIERVTGTPGAGAPAAPSNTLTLAQVTVPAGATSVTNSNIADTRVWVSPLNFLQSPSAAFEALRVQARAGQTADIFAVESSAAAKFLRVGSDGTVYLENGARLVAQAMRPIEYADSGSPTNSTGPQVRISGSPSGTFVAPPSGAVKFSLRCFLQVSISSTGSYALGQINVRTGSTIGSGTLVRDDVAQVANANTGWIKAGGMGLVTSLTPGSTYNFTVTVQRTNDPGTAIGSQSGVLLEPVV